MTINTGAMRVVGILLLAAAAIDALALTWNRPSAGVCQSITAVQNSLGGSVPSNCLPVSYTLALVLLCAGAGLIVVSLLFRENTP